MQIYRNGTLPTKKAPEQNFTGAIYTSDYLEREAPSRVISATVTMAPGARSPGRSLRSVKRCS